MWLSYVVFREAYLQSIREYVEADMQRAWRLSHSEPGENAIPMLAGC